MTDNETNQTSRSSGGGFLAAGLSQAIPSTAAPLPPNLKRGPRRDDVQEQQEAKEQTQPIASQQEESIATLQKGKKENLQKKKAAKEQSHSVATEQSRDAAQLQDEEISEEQLRYLARLLNRVTAKEQNKKAQKEDVAELLVQALATTQFSKFYDLAKSQRQKVNQGLLAPEALHEIYRRSAYQLSLDGPKTTVSDLMCKALIKYLVEDILPRLEP
jgi:hypothetical protein